MNKKQLILLALLSCISVGFAENSINENVSKNWSGTNSGDYVIYRDYSWKSPTWIGFLYYDKNTVGSFLYTDDGEIMVKIIFAGEELDGEFIITGQNIISGMNNHSTYTYAVNHLMRLLPKLYKWKQEPNIDSLVVKQNTRNIDDNEFGGKSTMFFYSYIPLFYLDSISNAEGKTIFKLEEMGLAKKEDDFFNFNPVAPIKTTELKFKLNEQAEKKEKTINSIKLNLDSQWEQVSQNSFSLNDTAFLVIAPADFSSITKIKNNEESFLIKYLCSSGLNAKVLLDKTDIIGNKDRFKIISPVYDVKTKTIKKTIKLIVKNAELKYTIISLSIDELAYEKYKEYFNNLF